MHKISSVIPGLAPYWTTAQLTISTDRCARQCLGWDITSSPWCLPRASQVALTLKNLPVNTGDVGREDPLEEGMATHSSILTSRLAWTEETAGLVHRSQRVRQDCSDWAHALSSVSVPADVIIQAFLTVSTAQPFHPAMRPWNRRQNCSEHFFPPKEGDCPYFILISSVTPKTWHSLNNHVCPLARATWISMHRQPPSAVFRRYLGKRLCK